MELHERHNSDLYVLDRFSDCNRLVGELEHYNVFRRIILIREDSLYKNKVQYSNLFFMRMGILRTYFNIDRIVESFLEKDVEYDEMYFTCHLLCFRLVRFYFIKHKYSTKFVMFDEGAGSYYGQFERSNIINTIVKRVLFGKDAANMEFETYLYQPQLYYNYSLRKKSIHQLTVFDDVDKNWKNNFFNIFNCNVSNITYKCIYFDGIREEICRTEYAQYEMQNWYQTIENSLGVRNIVIKSHPRAKRVYPHKCDDYPMSKAPMEVECLNMNMGNMVFISVASTAVVTPKIVYDEEPIVLLLCLLNKDVYQVKDSQIDFYLNVKSLYREQSRFMIPQDMHEFNICIQKIKKLII